MDVIKSKKKLHGEIKTILEGHIDFQTITFPQVLTFCEGMGEPLFKITIEKNEHDFFIDEKGQKWVKANDSAL
jgi:hypothetical protein